MRRALLLLTLAASLCGCSYYPWGGSVAPATSAFLRADAAARAK